MIEVPFALALAAGMVAALNPCGFAMLPAYLTYFVGSGEERPDGTAGEILRGLKVAGVLTLGFVAVFGAFGLVTTPFALSIEEHLPWVTIVIGGGLVVLGLLMAAGRQVGLRAPSVGGGGGGRELRSMFLFGVSYAVASLSCTIAPFLAVMTSTFRSANYLSGVLAFVTYGLGMGLLVGILTLAVALARSSVIGGLRRAMPYVTRTAGVLLAVAGLYVAWYGWVEVRTLRGDLSEDPITGFGEDVRIRAETWINDVGATRLAVAIGALLVVAVAGVLLARRRRSAAPTHVEEEPAGAVS